MTSRLFLPLVAAAATVAGADAQTAPAPGAVVLRPGDGVRAEILSERDRAGPAEVHVADVDADGMVLLPVVGLIRVVERPFAEVRRDVEAAFRREFVDGAVRITPLLRIAVLGEVRTPGLVSADPTMRLADVLAAVGGLTDSADDGDVRLVHESGESVTVDRSANDGWILPLRSGDRVIVGRRSWASENLPFLLGAGASVLAAVITSLLVR